MINKKSITYFDKTVKFGFSITLVFIVIDAPKVTH